MVSSWAHWYYENKQKRFYILPRWRIRGADNSENIYYPSLAMQYMKKLILPKMLAKCIMKWSTMEKENICGSWREEGFKDVKYIR